MTPTGSSEISALIHAWSAGDRTALGRLTPLIYDELRRMAKRYMRGQRAGQTLQTTALVHEAYLHLIDAKVANETARTFLPSPHRSCGAFSSMLHGRVRHRSAAAGSSTLIIPGKSISTRSRL